MSDDPDIYAIRRRAHRTQAQFADALGIPPNTLRSWEQQRKAAIRSRSRLAAADRAKA